MRPHSTPGAGAKFPFFSSLSSACHTLTLLAKVETCQLRRERPHCTPSSGAEFARSHVPSALSALLRDCEHPFAKTKSEYTNSLARTPSLCVPRSWCARLFAIFFPRKKRIHTVAQCLSFFALFARSLSLTPSGLLSSFFLAHAYPALPSSALPTHNIYMYVYIHMYICIYIHNIYTCVTLPLGTAALDQCCYKCCYTTSATRLELLH